MKNILSLQNLATLFISFSIALSNIAYADSHTLAKPTGEVILEVSGNLTKTNVDDEAHFDRAMIEALPSGTIVTANHVVSKSTKYEGPILSELLKHIGAKGKSVLVTALDDYTAELSYKDIVDYGVLLATHEGGRQLTLDDRGPLFVVFPFDQNKNLQHDLYYNQSVWQVMALEIE